MKPIEWLYAKLKPVEEECHRIIRGLRAKPSTKREFLEAYSGIDIRTANLAGVRLSDERLFEIAVGDRYAFLDRFKAFFKSKAVPIWKSIQTKYNFKIHRPYERYRGNEDHELLRHLKENNDTLSEYEKQVIGMAASMMMVETFSARMADREAEYRETVRKAEEQNQRTEEEIEAERAKRSKIRDAWLKRLFEKMSPYNSKYGALFIDGEWKGEYTSLLPKESTFHSYDTPTLLFWGYDKIHNIYNGFVKPLEEEAS